MGAISGLLPSNRTGENVRPPSSERFAGFFSAGLMSSPVSTTPSANAMRSQTDDEAKAT
jgi:hypothetical protein